MKNVLLGALLIFAAIALAISLTGCGKKQAKPIIPVLFKHCAFLQDVDGRQGCNCPNPLIVKTLDATTGKPKITAYCDGKVN